MGVNRIFHRRGTKNLNSDEINAEQAMPYLEYRRSLDELDFQNKNNVELAIYCFNINPDLVSSLDPNVANDVIALKSWIKRDLSNYFLCRKSGVDHVELLTLYLTQKFKQTRNEADTDLILMSSYDRKFVLNYQYETKRGETIAYFDEVLGIPASLVVRANLRIKLVNAQKLVEKLDVDLISIDLDLVKNYLTGILNSIIRDTVLTLIASKKPAYYELPQYYTLLNKGIIAALNVCFAECGWALIEFNLTDISVPNDTDKSLKNQLFAIAEAERIKNHEQKMERIALDLYERKAEIHNKYPNFPVGMTEAEKDLALNRYLNRIGKEIELKAEITEETLDERQIRKQGTRTAVRKYSVPKYYRPRNPFRIVYGVLVGVLYLVALGLFAVSPMVGGISLGGATLLSLVIGGCMFKLLKKDRQLKPIIVPEPEPTPEPEIDPSATAPMATLTSVDDTLLAETEANSQN